MSLRLLLDEDLASKILVTLLQSDGHDVKTIYDEGLAGVPDAEVLSCAKENQRVILTRNASHFLSLHESSSSHLGIMVLYQDKDPKKNLSYKEMVKAIANIENAGFEIIGQFIVLNMWSY